MFSLTIKSIRANKARFFLTGVAVMLGVAFMAGTLVLTDTIKQSYDDVAANVYKSTDAVVRSTRRRDRATGRQDVGARSAPRRSPQVRAATACRRPRRSSSASQSLSATTARCSTPTRTGRCRSRSAGRTTPDAQPDGARLRARAACARRDRHRPGVRRQGTLRHRREGACRQPGRFAALPARRCRQPTAAPTVRPAPR